MTFQVKETGDFLSNTRAEFASKQDEDRENSQEQEKAEEKESVTKDEDADNKEKDDAEEDNKAEENEEVPVEREEESSPVEPLEPNTDENEEQAVTISEPQTPKVWPVLQIDVIAINQYHVLTVYESLLT